MLSLSTSQTVLLLLFMCHPSSAFIDDIVEQVFGLGLIDFNDLPSSLFNLVFGRRRLLCAFKLIFILLTSQDRVFFSDKYRDTSVMALSEAGDYVGPDAIREYAGFIFPGTSPFVDVGPVTEGSLYRVLGFEESTGQCEFLWYSLFGYELNPELTEKDPDNPTRVSVSSLNTIYLDYAETFFSRFNIFYRKPFLRWYFGEALNTDAIRDFVCEDVLQTECNDPAASTCQADLALLPAATGDAYVDGDSLGCRILHAAFAISNPTGHCAHVTLDPNDADGDGKLRCSQSAEASPLELFDQETIDVFGAWETSKGIDPGVGYKLIDVLP